MHFARRFCWAVKHTPSLSASLRPDVASMIHVFALGAVGGLICGIAKQMWFPDKGCGSSKPHSVTSDMPPASTSNSPAPPFSRCRRAWNCMADRGLVAGGAAVVCACAAATAAAFVIGRQRRGSKGKTTTHRRKDGRIPLPDLIRFKERQWFVEELENARDADPNAMLRLAKMYLHGQGCQRNIALAQEWVRKARGLGVPASLDELFATDDPDPHGRLRTLAAREQQRRAMRQQSGATYPPHRQQQQQQQHTAAA